MRFNKYTDLVFKDVDKDTDFFAMKTPASINQIQLYYYFQKDMRTQKSIERNIIGKKINFD